MKISLKRLYIIMACVFMIRPYYIQVNTLWNMVWAYITCIMSIISLILVFKYRLLKEDIVLFVWLIILIISTLLNQSHNFNSAISSTLQIILAFNLGLLWKIGKYKNIIESVLGNVIFIYILMDLLCGMTNFSVNILGLQGEMTFLGYDNYAAYIILPLIAIKWAISFLSTGHLTKTDWICWIGELLYKSFYFSINAIMGLILFLIIYIICRHHNWLKKFVKPQYALAVVVILLIGIVEFHIQDVFTKLFLDLGKGTTLGFRTVIWGKLIPKLKVVPMIGFGETDNGFFQDVVGLSSVWDLEANHAHDFILEIWFTTGVLGVIIYVIFMIKMLKNAKYIDNMVGFMLLNGVFVYIIMGIIDGYPQATPFYLLLAFLYVYSKKRKNIYENFNAS